MTYGGFTATVKQLDGGIEVIYADLDGKELEREQFPGVDDYSSKTEHVSSRLKQFWEQRGY